MTARTPDFFIPGAPKAGTTAIASYLSEHPEIYIPVPKEPSYWGRDFPAYLHEQYGIRNRAQYLALFDHPKARAARWAGEASTHYLMSSHAISEILSVSPDAHFLVMVRNPIDLVHALHGEALFKRHETIEDFEAAWRLQWRRARGEAIPATCRVPRFLQYREAGAIASQIEHLLRKVTRSRVYIAFFDDLCVDPGTEYRQILAWLGVSDDGRTEFPRLNSSKVQRSRALANILHSPPRFLAPFVRVIRNLSRNPHVGASNLADRLMSRHVGRPPLRPAFRDELAAYFEAEIARLETITVRDLSHWRD